MKKRLIFLAYLVFGAMALSVAKSVLGVEVTAASDVAVIAMRVCWFAFGAGTAWMQLLFWLRDDLRNQND